MGHNPLMDLRRYCGHEIEFEHTNNSQYGIRYVGLSYSHAAGGSIRRSIMMMNDDADGGDNIIIMAHTQIKSILNTSIIMLAIVSPD